MDSKVDQNTGIRVQIDQSRGRTAVDSSNGAVFSTGLTRTANAMADASRLAAPFVPGGAVLSAAITGVGGLKNSASGQSAGVGSYAITGGNSTGLATAGVLNNGAAPVGGNYGGSTGGVNNTVNAMAAGGDKNAIMMQATQQMQEMNMSFNMQYLQLQQKMQQENREFTLLSNIMKTKHDTAKNAISNVR